MTDDIAASLKQILTALEYDRHLSEAISRLTTQPVPEDRVAEAAKLIRDRLPGMLDFGQTVEVDAILVGVEALARDILALTPPLPDEIAGLIAEAEAVVEGRPGYGGLLMRMAATLRALALENEGNKHLMKLGEQHMEELTQENARLQRTLDDAVRGAVKLLSRIRELEAEIREWAKEATAKLDRITQLEAERDKLKTELSTALKFHEQDAVDYEELRQERDAIRAKTIEECAQVVDQCNHEGPYNAIGAASRIRALATAAPEVDPES